MRLILAFPLLWHRAEICHLLRKSLGVILLGLFYILVLEKVSWKRQLFAFVVLNMRISTFFSWFLKLLKVSVKNFLVHIEKAKEKKKKKTKQHYKISTEQTTQLLASLAESLHSKVLIREVRSQYTKKRYPKIQTGCLVFWFFFFYFQQSCLELKGS